MPVILFNGKTYNSIEDMPANERKAYEQISEAKNIPAPQSSPVIEEDRGTNTFTLIIGGMVLCSALASVAMVVYYFVGR